MVSSTARYGTAVVIILVVLRLAVGWHFFKEGAKKLNDPDKFSSRYFLEAATGPFAELFGGFVPDRWGEQRLDRAGEKDRLAAYRDVVVAKLRFNQAQRKEADQVVKRFHVYADEFFADRAGAIGEYWEKVDWARKAAKKMDTAETPWQLAKKAEATGELAKWTSELTRFHDSYVDALRDVATRGDSSKVVKMPKYPDVAKSWIDSAVSYVVFGVGVLLMLGLFTRFASLVGAGFLTSVVLTQPPWVAGAEPTYYQIVELVALLLLCATAAGRFAGLDYFVNALWERCCPPKPREER